MKDQKQQHRPTKTWVFAPQKPANQKVPDDLKAVVLSKANELVEQVPSAQRQVVRDLSEPNAGSVLGSGSGRRPFHAVNGQ